MRQLPTKAANAFDLVLLSVISAYFNLMLDCQFCDLASEGQDIIMHQLKSLYNSPFKESYSHSIHTCFPMIASNVTDVCH